MQAHSARFDDALRTGGWRSEPSAVHRNLITGALTPLDIVDGSLTIDATSDVRRSLDLTVPSDSKTWTALDTVGGEISLTQTMVYVDGVREPFPQGVFIVDQDDIDYSASGNITITAPDRSVKWQRNRLAPNARSSVASNKAWQEVQRLVEGAWPGSTYPFPGWASGSPDESATTLVGSLLWDDGDRLAAINAILTANSLECFFDQNGLAVLRPIPVLTSTSTPVWTVDYGPTGVMVTSDRSRDRSRIANCIDVTTSATDVTFPPVTVQNTTPGDPYNVTGPLGTVREDLSLPTLRNSDQGRAAGLTRLAVTLGEGKQLTLGTLPNFALDVRDVIRAKRPEFSELHIIDTIVTPLVVGGGNAQQITTRSTRPDTDGT